MKTKLATMAMVLLCTVAFGKTDDAKVITGKSMTSLGDFAIEQSAESLIINGTTYKTYLLNYKNADRPIKIGVDSKKKCTNFIVKGPNFELEYSCKRSVFGAKKIERVYQEINENINQVTIDEDQLRMQQVISLTEKTESELLSLIACYLPMLVKEQFREQI